MAGYHDITAYKGSVFRYHFKLMDENQVPIDLITSEANFKVKKTPLGDDVLLDFSTSGVTVNYFGLSGGTLAFLSLFSPSMTGGITLNATYLGTSGDTGGIFVLAPSGIMENVSVGNWVYGLSITIEGNDEHLVRGRFSVDWNATK